MAQFTWTTYAYIEHSSKFQVYMWIKETWTHRQHTMKGSCCALHALAEILITVWAWKINYQLSARHCEDHIFSVDFKAFQKGDLPGEWFLIRWNEMDSRVHVLDSVILTLVSEK
jgi:hypothetical protein